VNRRAQAVVMLLVGLAVLNITFTGTYLRYVKPGLKPFLIAAAGLLIAAAVMTVWYQLRRDPSHVDSPAGRRDGGNHAGHGHGHGHHDGGPRVAWLLLAPVVVLALVAPQALGADAAGRSGSALQAPASDFPPLGEGDPVAISLLDYASRAVFDEGKSLAGRNVRILGFVVIGDDGQTYLARMIVSCCAADARPIKIGLTGGLPGDLAQDVWLTVTGTFNPKTVADPINGATIPFLSVTGVERSDQPNNPYQQ
jgi:uncharacterized repeat protein (TIGR03943 family)